MSTPFVEYFPTLVELAVVAGAFGFVGLAYTLAERYLPMGEHTGHVTGGFLAGSHPVPAMATAGVARIAEDGEVASADEPASAPAVGVVADRPVELAGERAAGHDQAPPLVPLAGPPSEDGDEPAVEQAGASGAPQPALGEGPGGAD